MTQREKTLVGAIVLVIVLWAAWQGFNSYQDSYRSAIAERARLEDELFDQDLEARRAREALRRLETLQSRSLPTDENVARSAYADWLKDTIQEAGLELDKVTYQSERRFGDCSTEITFNAAASGSPDAVVRLLDAYYRLDVLHQITNLQLRPVKDNADEWSVTLISAALVVDGTTRDTGVPDSPREPARLQLASADAYVDSILGRNLFSEYVPPPPPRPKRTEVARPAPKPKPTPPPFDDSRHARLTAIMGNGGTLEAWISVRTTGERLRLVEGDDFEIGTLKGAVKAVAPRSMTVESDGVEWTARLVDSKSLREAADDAS